MDILERPCLECGKQVKGRIDKKFCDDNCRNAYNNKQNAEQTPFVRKLNNILRKNRKLLESSIPPGEKMGKLPKQKLLHQGFNFEYHTHHLNTQKGGVYIFCYEYGYLLLEGDWVLVVKKKL